MTDQSVNHETVYSGEPKTVYESRCTCGETFVRATSLEATGALARHLTQASDAVSA